MFSKKLVSPFLVCMLVMSICLLFYSSQAFCLGDYTVEVVGGNFVVKDGTGTQVFTSTSAFQSIGYALNNTSIGGGVYVKGGVYPIDSGTGFVDGLRINQTCVLYGDGNNTKLVYDGDYRYGLIAVRGADNVVVRDMQLDGQLGSYVGNGWYGCYGVWVYDSDNVVLSNLYIHDTPMTGVEVQLSNNCSILDCVINDVSDSSWHCPAIRVHEDSNDALIDGCIIHNAYEAGIRTYIDSVDLTLQSRRTVITSNYVQGANAIAGIEVEGLNEYVHGNVVVGAGNVVAGGILCQQSNGTVVDANQVLNCFGNGVKVEYGDGVVVQNNYISGVTRNGILLTDASFDCVVSGNSISGVNYVPGAGVYVDGLNYYGSGNCTNNVVTGNSIVNCYYGTWEVEYSDFNTFSFNTVGVITASDSFLNAYHRSSGVGLNSVYGNNVYNPSVVSPSPPINSSPDSTGDFINAVFPYLVAVVLILIPAVLLAVVLKMGTWGALIGMVIGAAVGYGIPPVGSYVPLWLLFTVIFAVAIMAWKSR